VERSRRDGLAGGDGAKRMITILLVEDEALLLAFIEAILTQEGYTVIAAADPPTALRLTENGSAQPDLLVTDVRLPGMSGFELAQKLCARRPGLRLLYTSGAAGTDAPPPEAPSATILSKPFRAQTLLEAVHDALAGKRR
jgi:CheY-like chemotaxis protein